ncbi:membrane-associated protein, putative [Bodo saltans]|uniref:Membrane-associated protein, putative n=1 Tax=Bodo saltans TaxID=75058 RepID=A0A0S4IRS9_BODSA|nr:membrane-associated protein, putative [Bodo saltans]|eukprot:CUG03757.1 membrane-associated protein, putative [Bodo saltans]
MRSLPITSAVAAAAVVCLLTHAAVAFTKNIVRGGDSTVSGAYNYWDVGNECQMSGNSFSVEDTCAIGCNRDCYMTQSIDITFAKNYLLNPGAKVLVSMLGFIQGSDPDYASLTLSLLECTSGNTITLGGNQIETDSWATYTWGMWLPPNICTATVQLHLRNHAWDGDNPRAQTISLTLTGTGGSRSVALNATESATKTEERPTLTQSTSLAYTNTPTLTQDAPSSTSTQSSVLSLTTTSTQSSSVVSSQSLTNSSSPPSGTRSRDSSTWSTSPSRSSSPTGLITASPSQSHSPTRSISTSASSSASYSASQSNSASMSADGRTATATAVTFTGNYSETVGQLTLTRTLLLTESKIFQTKTPRHSSTPTISFNETTVTTALAHTNASSTPTFVTPVVSTTASALPLRTATPLPNASMTLTFIVPPPATQAPVSLVAEAALTSVTTAAILAAASSAAGPASMQAIMFQASCGEGGNAIGSAGARSSTMYLVSPFIGDSFAMVGGNIGLMFGFLLLHVCVLMVARCTALGKRNPRAAAALVRFPQISLLFAGTAMQGVMLGGWQLLWLVIRGETDDPAKAIICFVIALAAPALLFAGLWKLRTALLMPRICNTFWAVSVANRKRAQAKRIPYDGVGLDGLLIPKPWLRSLMRATGPSHLWTPQQHRAMFGAALNEARPRNALQMRWPLLESCVVPVIIAGAASIRPPDEHRKIVCGVAMPLTALMIIIVALLIVIRCPFRVQFKNMHRPLSLLWIALTALASQPAVFDALGEATTTNILAALSLAQTLTLVSVVTINWLIYYYVDAGEAWNSSTPPLISASTLTMMSRHPAQVEC